MLNHKAWNKIGLLEDMLKEDYDALFTLYHHVIDRVSGRVNKKALKEVLTVMLDLSDREADLNVTLKAYYDHVHGIKEPAPYEFLTLEDQDALDEIKEAYNAKRYRQAYDYLNPGPVKQKNTGFGVVTYGGFYQRFSYLFNLETYVRLNQLKDFYRYL